MSHADAVPTDRPIDPDDWPTAPERRYARAQADLAAHHGIGPDHAHGVESHTVETDSAGRIHYLVAGDPAGEPVLLLHGSSTSAATWLPMVPALVEAGFRVSMPDRPGVGLSDAPSYANRDLRSCKTAYLIALMDALDLERPHVVGSSLGGLQAFLLEIDHDRVDRLVLLGGPGGLTRTFPPLFRLLTMRGINRVLYWAMSRGDPVETGRDSMAGLAVEDTSAIAEPFFEVVGLAAKLPGRAQSQRSLANRQGSLGRMDPIFDIRDEIREIERPTLFVWGSEDAVFDPEVGRPVVEEMANAELVVLDGYGHMPWMEPGDAVEARVVEFLLG